MILSGVCQSSVGRLSVAYTSGPKSRTERPRKTKNGTEVAQVTRDSDTTFKVKRSKVKVTRPLEVSVGTYWPWETILLCCGLLGGARGFGAHRERRGAGHIVAAARLQLVIIITGRIARLTGRKSVFFHPAGTTRCTDSRENLHGRRTRGSTWFCKISPQSVQVVGIRPQNIKTFHFLVKSRLAGANPFTDF